VELKVEKHKKGWLNCVLGFLNLKTFRSG
jgi:hypothetical protein